MAYRFPKSLEMLDLYLRQTGFDVESLKSDRHALSVLIQRTGVCLPFPKRGVSCYLSLRRLHRELFPNVPMKKAPARARRVRGIGLIGPASDCRTIFSKSAPPTALPHGKATP